MTQSKVDHVRRSKLKQMGDDFALSQQEYASEADEMLVNSNS